MEPIISSVYDGNDLQDLITWCVEKVLFLAVKSDTQLYHC